MENRRKYKLPETLRQQMKKHPITGKPTTQKEPAEYVGIRKQTLGLALLVVCDELGCFTVNDKVLAGMENEMAETKCLRIPIRYFLSWEVRI
ncbi:MAG: hypothetical protein LUH07_07625 [Lachnospiraceae bacterium]|nr:hypothetical protein [Lachnospiraceae bacterium]